MPPDAIPAAWLPCPGKQRAMRAVRRCLLGLDHLAPVIVAAVRTDAMRGSRLAALRAGHECGQ